MAATSVLKVSVLLNGELLLGVQFKYEQNHSVIVGVSVDSTNMGWLAGDGDRSVTDAEGASWPDARASSAAVSGCC